MKSSTALCNYRARSYLKMPVKNPAWPGAITWKNRRAVEVTGTRFRECRATCELRKTQHRVFLPRSRRQPRNRAGADIVAAGNLPDRLALLVAAANRFALLVRRELRLAAEALPARLRSGPSFAGA